MTTSPASPGRTSAEALERYLGDPFDPRTPLSFARAVELDEREAFPEDALAALDRFGLPACYVPARLGGRLTSMPEFLSQIRVVARRDYTAAVAHVKTYLGAVSVWLSGSAAQQRRLSEVIANRELVALALTERDHGADVLANEVEAVEVEGGYLLSGEKWLINNATRATTLCVQARTSSAGGPRGYSMFLGEKRELDPASYQHLPKIRTHGIRGADISGIRFARCFVARHAVVGAPGAGLETVLRGFQITRTLIAGLSLGAADTALRLTGQFARGRALYGGPIAAIPHVRGQLAGAFADLLACECVATSAARALHGAPAQMSVWSAVVKYVVPVTAEAIVRDLAVVLGARHYLREEHAHGIFQKLMRDNAIASLFDGSTVVNLHAIIQQLGHLARTRARDEAPMSVPSSVPSSSSPERRARLAIAFDRRRALPDFEPARLELTSRGSDDLLGGLAEAADAIRRGSDALDAEIRELLTGYADELVARTARLDQRVAARSASYGPARHLAADWFELARHHCVLAAGAACLQTWLHNRDGGSRFLASGHWLALALYRLLRTLPSDPPAPPPGAIDVCFDELMTLIDDNQLLSLAPFPLAGEPAR
jgi:alkylation response protein AidB-like acyl-CoA dehydrogenase